jgi:hypothetical protein
VIEGLARVALAVLCVFGFVAQTVRTDRSGTATRPVTLAEGCWLFAALWLAGTGLLTIGLEVAA